jgi:hypothetical protein
MAVGLPARLPHRGGDLRVGVTLGIEEEANDLARRSPRGETRPEAVAASAAVAAAIYI